jgi:hypothetical protein
MYQLLSYVKYCQIIILAFITDLLWVIGLWIVGVMPNNGILPPPPRPVGVTKAETRENEESFWRQQDLMQSQQYIILMMKVTILKYVIFLISNNIA